MDEPRRPVRGRVDELGDAIVSRYIRTNILGFIAIFIALGGVGVAAGLKKNSVGSKQIKDGQVKSVDVADNGLTGTDIKESTLSGVPQGPAAPTGPAGGDLSGTYPNPALAADSVGSGQIAAGAVEPPDFGVLPAVRARPSFIATIPNSTAPAVALNLEDFDTSAMHSEATDNSRLTAPIDGIYIISGQASFAANATGIREARITKNGSSSGLVNHIVSPSPANRATDLSLSTVADLNAGDFVELRVAQESGGDLDLFASRTHLEMAWIAPGP